MSRVGFLLGNWKGAGVVEYATMKQKVEYLEEATFTAVPGRPVVHYVQVSFFVLFFFFLFFSSFFKNIEEMLIVTVN